SASEREDRVRGQGARLARGEPTRARALRRVVAARRGVSLATVRPRGWPTMKAMQVTVLLFASLAEKVGCRRLEVPLEGDDTVGSIRDRLVAAYPVLEGFVPSMMYALDEE